MQDLEKSDASKSGTKVKEEHFNGPTINHDCTKVTKQFKKLYYGHFFIDCNNLRDNCVLLKDNSIATIINIVEFEKKNIYLIGKKHDILQVLYENPLNSNKLNIHMSSFGENDLILLSLQDLKAKCWKISKKRNLSITSPLLHTFCQNENN